MRPVIQGYRIDQLLHTASYFQEEYCILVRSWLLRDSETKETKKVRAIKMLEKAELGTIGTASHHEEHLWYVLEAPS